MASPKRVAIIGAGAAGASTAYHLRSFSSHIPVNITIFDRASYVGGRSTTVNAYNSPSEPVELGASIFVKVNHILVNASSAFNLSAINAADRIPDGYSGPALGIWNGEDFVFTQSAAGDWWDTARLFWRYGIAPVKALRAMRASVGKFLTMYEAPVFPFQDLGEEVSKLGLIQDTGLTGEQLLREKGVGDLFAQELVQASTRVNYAQNLGAIHGLETLVCLATEGAMSIQGGNWQIFSRMAAAATSDVRLNTTVHSISIDDDKKFSIKTSSKDSSLLQFDEVIIAAPYQYSDLKITPQPEILPETIPYVELHVTLFASPHLLDPAAFNLSADTQVPLVVLTTLHPSESPGSKPSYAGKAGFFSISMLRPITNPETGAQEYLYKIFSPKPVSPSFLAKILGLATPKTMEKFAKHDVSWLYRKMWHSYPVEYPRVTFEKMSLAPGLWYTGGIESFISTMETSALMGKNVARLIVDGWMAENAAKATSSPSHKNQAQYPVVDGSQKVLKAKL